MNYKKIDELSRQVGAPLRLTSLIISRARQVIKGAPLLVNTKIDDPVQIAFLELMQNKIKLNEGNATEVLESKKAEKTLELIIGRVKEKFPNNTDTKVILASGDVSSHVDLKTETELLGPVIANIFQPRKPERTWTRESGWQSALREMK